MAIALFGFLGMMGFYSISQSFSALRPIGNSAQVSAISSSVIANEFRATAGWGMIGGALAIYLIKFHTVPDDVFSGLPILFYLFFALVRAHSLRKYIQLVHIRWSIGFCVLINLFWPLISIAFIPLEIFQLGDDFALCWKSRETLGERL